MISKDLALVLSSLAFAWFVHGICNIKADSRGDWAAKLTILTVGLGMFLLFTFILADDTEQVAQEPTPEGSWRGYPEETIEVGKIFKVNSETKELTMYITVNLGDTRYVTHATLPIDKIIKEEESQ